MSKPKESFLPPLWVLTSVTIVGLIWLAAQLRELVVLLVIGYFVAYAIDPILSKLESKGLSRCGRAPCSYRCNGRTDDYR